MGILVFFSATWWKFWVIWTLNKRTKLKTFAWGVVWGSIQIWLAKNYHTNVFLQVDFARIWTENFCEFHGFHELGTFSCLEMLLLLPHELSLCEFHKSGLHNFHELGKLYDDFWPFSNFALFLNVLGLLHFLLDLKIRIFFDYHKCQCHCVWVVQF